MLRAIFAVPHIASPRSDMDMTVPTVAVQPGATARSRVLAAGLGAVLLWSTLVSPFAVAQPEAVDDRPDPFAMVGDLLVARPIGAAMTAVGAAAFVVSLPFTALSGHVGEAAETLVLGPAETTFMRCLGCREPGYSYKDAELRQQRLEERRQRAIESDERQQQP